MDCTAKTHTNLFERADYLRKGNKKKKIQLVEKNLNPKLRLYWRRSLKVLLAINLMLVIQITLLIKPLQACQNYQNSRFLRELYLPSSRGNNVHSLDSRTSNSLSISCSEKGWWYLREDHFTFISNDLTHNVPFVELCNSMIHTYYGERDINIELDIEFNDGSASQYKCVRTI